MVVVQSADGSDKLRPCLQRVDTCEFGLRWLHAERVDGRCIHARSEVVTHLLLHGGAVLRLRVGLQDSPEKLLVLVGEFGVNAPAGLVGRDWVVLLPAATGELIEVDTGIDGSVEAGEVERRRIGHRLYWLGRGLLCVKAKDREEKCGGRKCGQKLRRHEFSCVLNPNCKSV